MTTFSAVSQLSYLRHMIAATMYHRQSVQLGPPTCHYYRR